MHYKFIWYCFLVIFANTLLQYFLTIDFTGRIKKKPPRARVRQILLQHQNPGKCSHCLHPASADFRLRLVCLLLFACFVICFPCRCMCFAHAVVIWRFGLHNRQLSHCSTAAIASPRSGCAWFISCCLHVSSVDFVSFHVNAVCFAHAVAFWQVGLHNRHLFALRMRLISDWLFFSNDVWCPFDDSTVGWTL